MWSVTVLLSYISVSGIKKKNIFISYEVTVTWSDEDLQVKRVKVLRAPTTHLCKTFSFMSVSDKQHEWGLW